MPSEDRSITPGMMLRMTRATAVTEAQYLEAERIATSIIGVGSKHPDREVIIATLMQVLATNLNAVALVSNG